ncbi:MAG: hypothetical protein FWC78_04980 [Defluviitaleaceae bacterium]|nr:hypothetical protein [Defluviitaleaceae bacterium]
MVIKIPRPEGLQALYEKATSDAAKHGIVYEGDLKCGSASGHGFAGSYIVEADFITIKLTKKPLLASKARIENEIKKYLAGCT